ncbi:beta strand repeat-containing protein [Limnoglobus roseus]|uniref:Autotransporter-like repeat protein n=1 Tax=Limnoglobus roseus TaxID=2598579 RepID=A0A5C1ADL3_9BACT|nr:autotransporter-associated beta strand repeat-containing protein [Limnoglobus roseus]QEL16257.1 autotransporter-like repeat protein [Limnoglobus roseus]
MPFSKLSRWLPKSLRPVRRPLRTTLSLQPLEAREVPATHIWTGANGNFWNDNGNWTGGKPTTGEVGGTVVQLGTNTNTFQNIPNLNVDQLVFTNNGSATLTLLQPLGLDGSLVSISKNVINPAGTTNSINGTSDLKLLGTTEPYFAINGTLSIDTSISGTQDLRLNEGGGVLELNKPNSYAGDTIVNQGILRLNGGGSANNTIAATNLKIGNNVGPAGEAVVQVNVDGQIPNIPIIVGSDGVLNLLGHTDFVGGLTLNGGQLATGGGTLGLNDDITVTANATLNVDGATKAGNVALQPNDHNFDVAPGVTLTVKTRLTGPGNVAVIGGGTVAYENAGPTANDYTGQTRVYDGTLTLHDAALNSAFAGSLFVGDGTGAAGTAVVKLLTTSEIPNTGVVKVSADGLLDLNGFNDTLGSLSLEGNGQIVTNGSKLGVTSNIVVQPGTTQFNITGDIDFSGSGFGAGSVLISDAASTLVIDGVVSGDNGLSLSGQGTLRLDGSSANTYTGTTTVTGGTLLLNHTTGPAVSNKLNLSGSSNGAVVRLAQDNQLPADSAVTMFASTLDVNGHQQTVGKLSLSANTMVTTGTGKLTLGGDVSFTSAISGQARLTGNFDLGTGDRVFTIADSQADIEVTIDGIISGGAAANLIKDGAGTLEITGLVGTPNTYGGKTWVKDGRLLLNDFGFNEVVSKTVEVGDTIGAAGSAILQLEQSAELPTDATVTVHADGLFDLSFNGKNRGQTIGTLTLDGGRVERGTLSVGDITATDTGPSVITSLVSFLDGPHTITVADGAAAEDLRIEGPLASNSLVDTFVKAGPGTLALAGVSTYARPTSITAGTLLVDGSSPASPITLTAGTLGGSGSIGTVTATGGSIAPGSNSTATLTTKSLALGGATFLVELGGTAAGQFDQLKAIGTVDLTGAMLNVSASFTPSAGQQFTILDNDDSDAIVGTFAGRPEGQAFTLAGRPFTITYHGGDGNDVVLIESTPNTPPMISDVTGQTSDGSAVGPVGFTVNDTETPGGLVVTASSSNPTLIPDGNVVLSGSGGSRMVTLTPVAGQAGSATITLTVTDPAGQTATDTFTLTVTLPPTVPPTNTPPTISAVADQTTAGSPVGPLNFTVNDAETPPANLNVTASSSNVALVPVANITIGGSGMSRTVTVAPAPGQTGTATITLIVTDASGAAVSETFDVVVSSPAVNQLPTISDVGNQTGTGVVGPVAFIVGDLETAAANLSVTAVSSNPALIPSGNIAISGSGANRTVTVTPVAGQTGATTITLTVTDVSGGTATDTFTVTVSAVTPPPVATAVAPKEFAAGAGAGGQVRFFNADGSERFTVTPFPGFAGGVRTAAADFNGDGVADLVVGTGPGRATRVRVLDGVTQAELFTVDPFEATFTGGVYVAAGDVTGDGVPELVISPDEGGGPRVRVFSGNGFGVVDDFFGIDDPNFRGGARAAVGDLNGDGDGDLIVVAGFGGGPRVAAFDGTTLGGGHKKLFGDFFAFEQALRNGVFVTAGDVNGDGFADLIAGGGPGGGPRVLALDGKSLLANAQTPLANFFGGDTSSRAGIHVAVKNLDGDALADIVVGAGTGSRVTAYLGKNIGPDGTPASALDFDAVAGVTTGVFVG